MRLSSLSLVIFCIVGISATLAIGFSPAAAPGSAGSSSLSPQCQDCNGTCCDQSTQSCCSDPVNGGVCCMKESTYCCPLTQVFPSRCCPRWFICCNGGRYGCCQPDGKPMEEADQTAYGLYVDVNSNFAGMTIDMSSGTHTYQAVSGFNDWGETTRVFTFDGNRNLFYMLQADFLSPGSIRNITLFASDPVKGTTVKKTVQGAVQPGENDVPGFQYLPKSDTILLSTTEMNGNSVIGYNFYSVNPTTAVATLLSKQKFSSDTFSGWFHDVASNGTTLYRIGFQDVINQQNPGVAVIDISTPIATSKWISNLNVPSDLSFYETITVYGNSFLSLAADGGGDYSLVKWDLTGNAAVLTAFDDAYDTPWFGPTIEFLNAKQTLYGALLVYDSIDSDFDRWELVLVDPATGDTQALTVYPWILAEVTSMAALGFA